MVVSWQFSVASSCSIYRSLAAANGASIDCASPRYRSAAAVIFQFQRHEMGDCNGKIELSED
jgi:hypothetical protein